MAEIRCPMCSKSNPEDAEVCQYCDARLKPLIVDQSEQELPVERSGEPEPTGDIGPRQETDWLSRMRAEAERDEPEAEIPAEEVPPEADTPDWLTRLRPAEDEEEGPPEGEVPDWVSETGELVERKEPKKEVPDWLSRIREREAAEQEEAVPDTTDEDWLTRLREESKAEPEEARIEIPEPDLEPDLEPMEFPPEEPMPSIDFESIAEIEEPEIIPGPEEIEIPGDEEEPLGVPSLADQLKEDLLEEDLSWFEPSEPSVVEEPLGEEPLHVDEDEFEEAPIIPEDFGAPKDEEFPHVPPLILDEIGDVTGEELQDLDLDAIELPEWFSEIKDQKPRPQEPVEEGPPDLAPATLPSWLEAMRPVETFQSIGEIEAEEDRVAESAGPLAGLRGVLMAEPVVAMPRSVSIGASHLDVTERQYAQAEMLHRIVEEEEHARPAVIPSRRRLQLLRWGISLILVLAVALPSIFPNAVSGMFPLPSRVPRDLGPLFALVENVPLERPVLFVFDYTPGYFGELDAVAGAILEHIMARQLQVATVSTWPTGPPLAERLLSRFGGNGTRYLHLGYLSGGPTAVQLFAAAPREAVLRGFMLPEDLESRSGWQSPMLENVTQLSDFGLVAVITTGTESARTWAEQAHPWMGDTPLVMVLSAGAEPLVRPYYEALEPQVNGILAGIPSAVAYEQINRRPGDAEARWDAFGMGMLAVELLLIVGGIYGASIWLLRSRGEADKG